MPSCYHPLTAYRLWDDSVSFRVGLDYKEKLMLRCGKCIGCRMDRSKQWAIRAVHEASLHSENCFLTLTYTPEKLIEKCSIYNEHDEIDGVSLNKKEFVLFMKRLRKKVNKKIRFLHCGEYGTNYGRPHHHVCLFGYSPPDLIPYTTRQNITLYTSSLLTQIWSNGYVTVGDVTAESAAYCARYVLKKVDAKSYMEAGREPEYITMSRKPGLAAEWLQKYHADIYNYDMCVTHDKSVVRPPKYYDSLYDRLHPDEFDEIKERRKNKIVDKSKEDLQRNEDALLLKLNRLKRSYENDY